MSRGTKALLAATVLAALLAGQARAQGADEGARPAAGAASAIPFKREPAATQDMAFRTLGALALCLALGGLAVFALRGRLQGGKLLAPGTGRLQVLESRRIAPKAMLVVVRWNAEDLLLSHGEGGTTLLARAPAVDAAQREAP